MTDDPQYINAKREVSALKGFYIHALVYACVITGLFGLNMMLPKSGWWFHWPAIGWGIGLFFHGLLILAPLRVFDTDWEDRKIKERLERK
jgi:cyanate permease